MSVIISGFFLLLRPPLLTFFLGRDREYQDLNLNFVFNVAISATIIGWFPKPLKRCVVLLYPCFFVNETPPQHCFTHVIECFLQDSTRN